ncbi:hypothetical protein STEG23_034651, partial [Scotinomys teguina]
TQSLLEALCTVTDREDQNFLKSQGQFSYISTNLKSKSVRRLETDSYFPTALTGIC